MTLIIGSKLEHVTSGTILEVTKIGKTVIYMKVIEAKGEVGYIKVGQNMATSPASIGTIYKQIS
jgi:hypothetical protein